jgi:hypothetical protein
MSTTDIKEIVKEKYGQAALRVKSGGSSCCGASPVNGSGCCDPITSNLYDALQAGQIPEEALLASLGCGNPTALANLNPGEVVLDLGSGGTTRRLCPRSHGSGIAWTQRREYRSRGLLENCRVGVRLHPFYVSGDFSEPSSCLNSVGDPGSDI